MRPSASSRSACSLVHVLGVAVLDAVEHAFEIAQEVGHDAQNLAAGIAGVGGDSAHQPDIAAAIDRAPAAGGDGFAELAGELEIAGFDPGAEPQ